MSKLTRGTNDEIFGLRVLFFGGASGKQKTRQGCAGGLGNGSLRYLALGLPAVPWNGAPISFAMRRAVRVVSWLSVSTPNARSALASSRMVNFFPSLLAE